MLHHLPLLFSATNACSTPIFPGGPGLYDGLCNGPNGTFQAPSAISDFLIIIANVVRLLLALAGALGIAFIVLGGIFYATSAGDPTRIKRARELITNVVVGLAVILLAYAIVTYVAGIGS